MHSFLSREGMPPTELLAIGRAEVRGYGGEIVTATVLGVERTDAGFEVGLDDGSIVAARRLLVAPGLTDELPDVPGLRGRWGRDVVHCPYCHGYEVRDQPLGVLARTPMSVHQALLVRQLSADVAFFAHTAELSDEDREQLAARGVQIVEGVVTRIVVDEHEDRLAGVELEDRTVVGPLGAVRGARFVPNDTVLTALGAETAESPFGSFVRTDPMGRTSVPGVWAVGNVADPAAFVVNAAGAGARAAAAINLDLVEEEVALAMASRVPGLSDRSGGDSARMLAMLTLMQAGLPLANARSRAARAARALHELAVGAQGLGHQVVAGREEVRGDQAVRAVGLALAVALGGPAGVVADDHHGRQVVSNGGVELHRVEAERAVADEGRPSGRPAELTSRRTPAGCPAPARRACRWSGARTGRRRTSSAPSGRSRRRRGRRIAGLQECLDG